MKKETHSPNPNELKDATTEPDDYSDTDASEPKHSPMRRRGKFRPRDFLETEKKHKDRKRNSRHKIRHNFE